MVSHGDSVGDGDGGEFARRAVCGFHALLGGCRLSVERDVARSRFVPAGCDADEGLSDLFFCHAHRVVVGAVRRAGRTDADMARGQVRLGGGGRKQRSGRGGGGGGGGG